MNVRKFILLVLAAIVAVTAFVPASPAYAASKSGTYACTYLNQSPKDWTVFKSRADFDASWTVLNSGTASWNGVDLIYLGGTSMHTKASRYDVTKIVKPNGKVKFTVDMEAPKNPGFYVTYWGLTNGSQVFCRFYTIVRVK